MRCRGAVGALVPRGGGRQGAAAAAAPALHRQGATSSSANVTSNATPLTARCDPTPCNVLPAQAPAEVAQCVSNLPILGDVELEVLSHAREPSEEQLDVLRLTALDELFHF